MSIQSFPARLPEAIQRLYPFRTRTLSVPTLTRPQLRQSAPAEPREAVSGSTPERMSYVDEGTESAPPLLLVHGNLTWSFLFRDLIGKARERFRVVAPDLVGFGLSSKPRDAAYHALAQHAENLTQLIHRLKLTKVTLVLHDWGGPIGLRYAMRFPENVTRIVLLSTWGHPPGPSRGRRGADEPLPLWLRLARNQVAGPLLRRWTATAWPDLSWAVTKKLEDAVRAAYSFPFRRVEDRVAPLALARMTPPATGDPNLVAMDEQDIGLNLNANLKKIRARVQILWGEQDTVHRGKLAAYRLRDSFPNCGNPAFLPQASWLIPEDAPEALAEKVLQSVPKPGKEPLFKII